MSPRGGRASQLPPPSPRTLLLLLGSLGAGARAGPAWDVAVGRRPYIGEANGELLLYLEPATEGKRVHVTASLPCINKTWQWDVQGGSSRRLPLGPLGGMPPRLNNDIIVSVAVAGKAAGVIRRRFMRAARPSAAASSQVDHASAGLLVDGKPWVGTGWYVYPPSSFLQKHSQQYDDCEGAKPGSDLAGKCAKWRLGAEVREMAKMAERGVNIMMPYGMLSYGKHNLREDGMPQAFNDQLVLRYLNNAAANGLKVLLDMSTMDLNQPCCHGPNFSGGVVSWVAGVVNLVKSHRALLGYYICDDCCTTSEAESALAQVYNTIKELDPFHITAGSVFLGCIPPFGDVPSRLPPASDDKSHVLPGLQHTCKPGAKVCTGIQPKTQLSLDWTLVENYAPNPGTHAKEDVRLRQGMRFEAVANCPGSYNIEPPHIERAKPPGILLTNMWLSVVTSGTLSQVVFAGSEPDKSWTNYWFYKKSWMLYSQIEYYATEMSVLQPFLSVPFDAPQPTATVENITILLPKQPDRPSGKQVLARAWGQPRGDKWCGHLVVVSTVEQGSATFTLKLAGTFPVKNVAARTAQRLFDADYKVVITDDGHLTDTIGPARHIIYELGECGGGGAPPLRLFQRGAPVDSTAARWPRVGIGLLGVIVVGLMLLPLARLGLGRTASGKPPTRGRSSSYRRLTTTLSTSAEAEAAAAGPPSA